MARWVSPIAFRESLARKRLGPGTKTASPNPRRRHQLEGAISNGIALELPGQRVPGLGIGVVTHDLAGQGDDDLETIVAEVTGDFMIRPMTFEPPKELIETTHGVPAGSLHGLFDVLNGIVFDQLQLVLQCELGVAGGFLHLCRQHEIGEVLGIDVLQ